MISNKLAKLAALLLLSEYTFATIPLTKLLNTFQRNQDFNYH
jgi:hypothetical protein